MADFLTIINEIKEINFVGLINLLRNICNWFRARQFSKVIHLINTIGDIEINEDETTKE